MAVVVFGLVAIATILVAALASRRAKLRLRERLSDVVVAEAGARRLLDELPEAVMLLDAEGRVLSANQSAAELCGVEPTALIQSFFLHLVGAADRDELRANWREGARWSPAMPREEADRLVRGWHKAVTRTYGWVDEDVR